MNNLSISIIVPAYNEEKNLRGAVETVVNAINKSGKVEDYEILVLNDCSTDKTGEVADRLAVENSRVKVIHNPRNMGFGYNYKKGVELASKNFIMLWPGDNEIEGVSVERICNLAGTADMIIPYIDNPESRSLSRRIISRSFVLFLNFLFGFNIKYYNGIVLHRAENIKNFPMSTHGFAYQAEILTKLMKSGRTYKEVGMTLKKREYGKTKIFKLKNIVSVVKTVGKMYWDNNIKKERL